MIEKRQAINTRVSQSFVSQFLNSSKVHYVFKYNQYNLGTLKATSIPFYQGFGQGSIFLVITYHKVENH